MSDPSVSVVIAAWPDTEGLETCLAALDPQRRADTQVIVVSPQPAPPSLSAACPWVAWVEAPPKQLIPHLWSAGIARAAGEVVALTTAHFVPAADWIRVIANAHARLDSPAIGGPIDPPRGRPLVDWATYFLRYSQYLGFEREQLVDDVAGDNAAYVRAALVAHPELVRAGFWELEFHKRLRRDGRTIAFVPSMRVRQQRAFGFGPFLGHRFRHGREFGQARLRGRAGAIRLAAVFASPLIPAVLAAKIAVRVARSRRDFGPFLLSSPILFAFILAWALGEAAGYLKGGVEDAAALRASEERTH